MSYFACTKEPRLQCRAQGLHISPGCAGEAADRLPLPRLRLSTARGSQKHPRVPVRGDTTTPRQEEMRHQQSPQSLSGHQHWVQPGWTRPRWRPVPPSENPRKTLRSTRGPEWMSGFLPTALPTPASVPELRGNAELFRWSCIHHTTTESLFCGVSLLPIKSNSIQNEKFCSVQEVH